MSKSSKNSQPLFFCRKLRNVLQNLLALKIGVHKHAEIPFEQYILMHEEVMRADNSIRISFDDFSFIVKLKIAEYMEMVSILTIIVAMRLGQPSIKCGLSCNVNLLEENIKFDSIFSKPLDKDHVVSGSNC